MNVGAASPEDPGLYFSWGNSPGHEEGSGYDFSLEVYNETPGAAIEGNLTLAEDMARQSLGTPWRMPAAADFQELYDNCTYEWTSLNNVHGYLFTSSVNGKTLFLPAAGRYDGTSLNGRGSSGRYWSSTYNSESSARNLTFDSSNIYPQEVNGRRNGFTVRAVAKL